MKEYRDYEEYVREHNSQYGRLSRLQEIIKTIKDNLK